ncbi:MAG: potassium transporter TrkG, partial [Pseudomonadota bacterium]
SMFLMLMFLGGCAGSAACGIKIFRLEIAVRAIVAHAQRMVSPNRLAPVRYNGRVVDEDTIQSVLVFMFLYLATFVITGALLGLTGLDTVTAISGAATSVSNVGPGLGSVIGPKGTFESLPATAKWICSFAMLLGRLEFIAMFVVLTPRFWRG